MSVRQSSVALSQSLFAPARVTAVMALAGLGVLCASKPAQADAKAALPASVDTFKMTKPVQTFSPGTLEKHIDGQAESVMRYDFKQCDYAEYAPGGAGNQLITVDIYEMGSPLDSYGYYSYQLAPSAKKVKFIKFGAVEGYQTRDGINFWKGQYYVNVTITAANAPSELPGRSSQDRAGHRCQIERRADAASDAGPAACRANASLRALSTL